MGRFWGEFKMAMRDQAVGSMKYGASMSISHNAAAMKAAREERLAEENRSRRVALLGHIAQREVLKASSEQVGRDVQYVDDECEVRVKSGHNRNYDKIVTDIIVVDRTDPRGGHVHIVVDEWGNVLHEAWKTY